ncbi:unnamed protein product [Calicophoron daubneyi]|uniref:Uncharacterized protein n=1 Tax=Calicophoron daubneyi TaxID=300641 RepID=A0AAV2TKR5_CALDB
MADNSRVKQIPFILITLFGVAPLVFPEMMCTLYCQPTDSLNYFNSQSTGVPNAKDNGTNHSYTATVPAPNNVDSQGPEKQVAAHTTAYTWGSRGPALDGSLGLCVAAPGAANTSTSSWQLRPAALLNGSSMSSPLVAGSIALIISGLRGKFGQISNSQNENNGPCKIPPCLIRLALTNTACPVKHLSLLDQGSGVIRVDKAFEYILNSIQWAQSQLSAQNLTLDTEGQFKDVTKKAKIANLQVTKDVTANSESVETQFPTLSTSCSLSAYYGWRVRCTVSGPGCYIKSRGIWLRQGCPHVGTERTNSSSEQLKLPLLRYTLLIKIDFDKCVPLEMRRNMELHLRMSVVSYTKEIKGGGVEVKTENEKPPWLQVAPFVSVTGTPREIKLCLDPNQIPCFRCRYERRQLSNSKPESETAEAHAISSYPCENQMSTSSPACVASSSVAHLNHSPPIFQSTETHLTMLNFTDPSYPTLGVLAQVPIILQDPIRLPPAFSKDHPRIFLSDNFDAIHKVRRWFVRIPSGASAGVLKLVRLDDNAPDCDFKVTICLPQLRSGLSTGQQEVTWPSFNLARCIGNGGFSALPNSLNTESTKLVFPIGWESDYMELTIAQNWGLEAPAVVFGELAFHGLEPNLHELALQTSSRYTRLMLRSNFTTEEIWPTIALTHWNLPLRPTTSKIFYLGQNKNEALLTGRGCYALRLLYEFSCPYKTSTVNIMLPWLQELLYDSDYVLQIYHLYDWRGKFIGAADYDSKWPKSSKCSFPVEKGDYKVLFQICHETGPNLTTEKIKQESSFVDDQATRKTGGSATTTSTSTGGDALSPLERLRNHPAIVRFTLPTTGNLNVPSDRRESCSVLTNPPVTFEFAVFPFSLGLNGSKPCSALDPIPYREFADTFPSSVQSREIDFVEANEELGCDQAAKPGELNRHCPHLPRSLGPGECTALYVGLTDERYPTYAVSGSYFSGSIGFYKSELLHSTITYPFRLIMDGDSAEKPAAAEVGHSTNVLTVGNLGLSAEDFNWLHPMTQLITGQSPPDGKVDEYSDHQKSTASQSPPLIADQAFKTKDPDKSPGQTKQAMNGADLAKSSSTDEKGEKEPESQSLATPPMNDKQPPVDLSSSERSYASPTLLDDNNLIPTIKDACQSLGNLEDNTANIPQLAPQPLSDRFVCAHNRLLDLDKPYSFNDKPNPQAREELWSAVDDLFVGHSVRHVVTDSNQPDVSGGLDRDCLLYHLLTMRLVRSQTKTSNMGSSSGKAGNASADDSATDPNLSATSETKIPTTQSETDLTKAAKNEGDDSLSKQSLDPTKRPSAKPADEKPGGISEKPQPSKSTSGTTYNYLELKLRTIDTLARYGRLLCERIILTDLLGADPNTEHETASHADSTGRRNSWSLLDVVDERALPSGCEPSHSECGQLLDRIHARLVELTSSAPSVSNSVGEHVRVGAHAIPSWLLASGYSKHSPGHPKHCDLEQNSWQCGSVGGRLVIFFLLYSLAKHQYPHALRLLTRILYQVKEPPTNSLSGPVSCGPTPSLGQLRRVVASQTGSLQTSKMGFPWLLWVLRRLNWTALEYQLKQNAPVLFPECDYTLMGDQ